VILRQSRVAEAEGVVIRSAWRQESQARCPRLPLLALPAELEARGVHAAVGQRDPKLTARARERLVGLPDERVYERARVELQSADPGRHHFGQAVGDVARRARHRRRGGRTGQDVQPESPPTLNFTGTPNVAGKLFAQVASPTVARDTTLATSLSDRERDVLRLLAQGLSNAEIAGSLFLSEGTIRNYVSAIFEKLGVSDRTRAALMAVRHGLVD
jgi:DNA-binding CsgD family transcriptional regulator